MKNLSYITAVVLALTIASCKKEPFEVYTDVSRLQFGPDISRIYTPSYMLADTLKQFTFYYENQTVTEGTVFFDVYAMGQVAKTDRTFTLAQELVPNVDNAVAGKDYVPFNDAKATKNFVIKAGTSHALVPILLLRSTDLKTKTLTLKFNIVANDNFQMGVNNYTWRKITFTDRLGQPSQWSKVTATFGTFSLIKYQFIIDTTKQRWDDDYIIAAAEDPGLLKYWLGVMKTALAEYNNAHPGNPLKSEIGNVIAFPAF